MLQLTLDNLNFLQVPKYCHHLNPFHFRKHSAFSLTMHWSKTFSTTNSSGSASSTLLLFPFCFFPMFCNVVLLEANFYCRLEELLFIASVLLQIQRPWCLFSHARLQHEPHSRGQGPGDSSPGPQPRGGLAMPQILFLKIYF